jgi:tyrosyl-DNA phosphodiesterase 2
MVVRVLTWNVWFGSYMFDERADAVIAEIARRRPEVVALQEVTPPLRERLTTELAGYELHGADNGVAYDVALLTRVGVDAVTSLALPTRMGRRLLTARLANGLVVATIHLESTAPCVEERATQLQLIGPALIAAGDDVVLVGDMNFDDAAVIEPRALDASLVDVWPTLHRDPGFTVDSTINTMRGALVGEARKRIDRAFLRGNGWRASSIELVGTNPIDDTGTFASDHFGLALELRPA